MQQRAQLIEQNLFEKNKSKGNFRERADISQKLKNFMRENTDWDSLPADKRECLEEIGSAVSCILNGDPEYLKAWCKIIEYGTLAANEIDNKIPKDFNQE
jgi:hypothetical protein